MGGVRFPEQLQTSHLKHNRLFLWPQLLFPSALWPQSCSVASNDMCSENSFTRLSPSRPPTLLKMQSLLCGSPRSFTLNIATVHSHCHPARGGALWNNGVCTEHPPPPHTHTPVWKLAESRHSALAPSCRRQCGSQYTTSPGARSPLSRKAHQSAELGTSQAYFSLCLTRCYTTSWLQLLTTHWLPGASPRIPKWSSL